MMVRKKAQTLGFRLPPNYVERLETEAEKAATSSGEFARRIVMDWLDDQSRGEFSQMKEEVKELRTDLAAAVEAMLVGAGKVSAEEAKGWVTSNLRK